MKFWLNILFQEYVVEKCMLYSVHFKNKEKYRFILYEVKYFVWDISYDVITKSYFKKHTPTNSYDEKLDE